MRYLTIPAEITCKNPFTDEPLPDQPGVMTTCTFARSCRIAITQILNEAKHDVLEVLDMLKKTDQPAGTRIELTNPEYEWLKSQFSKPDPKLFGLQWIIACEPHVRAVLDAPTAKPAEA